MIVLEDITLKEYIDLEDKKDYNFAIQYAFRFTDSEDTFNIGDVTDLSFEFVKDYQYELQNGLDLNGQIKLLKRAANIKDHQLGKVKLDVFFRGLNYLHDGIIGLTKAEANALSYTPSAKEEAAGIENFNKYGSYSQFRKLAGNDILKIEKIKKLKYSECFIELLYLHDEYVFQEKLSKQK